MKKTGFFRIGILIGIAFSLSACSLFNKLPFGGRTMKEDWDKSVLWKGSSDGVSKIEIKETPVLKDAGLEVHYQLAQNGGWVQMERVLDVIPEDNIPVIFNIKSEATGDFELKFVDSDKSTFGRKISLGNKYRDWTPIVVYKKNLDYWWGGDAKYKGLKAFHFAFSGKGHGTVWLDSIGLGNPKMKSSFPAAGPKLDPDRKRSGCGFIQRRAKEMIPEDSLVLEWLKQMQDTSSPDKQLLPSMEDNIAQTFNNAIGAIAFILKGERKRAERILDFYSSATVKENQELTLQNFFYKGEARGFYQFVVLKEENGVPAYHNPGNSDRWVGDMAWLLIAYKYYEKKYESDKYEKITELLKDLLISFYRDAEDGKGGYIQHGWRKGDTKLHENSGHHEGNIDCYAALKLCGEKEYAQKVRTWLENNIHGNSLPLDLYTWRVLAYGKDYAHLLDIPEFDLRYRKVVFKGRQVTGLYHTHDENVNNIWLDGTAHMACAYFVVGNKKRGYFYSNQLDAFLMDRIIGDVKTRALPYTANKQGIYDWVDVSKGFTSVAAWYIFAKNQFNPLMLEKFN